MKSTATQGPIPTSVNDQKEPDIISVMQTESTPPIEENLFETFVRISNSWTEDNRDIFHPIYIIGACAAKVYDWKGHALLHLEGLAQLASHYLGHGRELPQKHMQKYGSIQVGYFLIFKPRLEAIKDDFRKQFPEMAAFADRGIGSWGVAEEIRKLERAYSQMSLSSATITDLVIIEVVEKRWGKGIRLTPAKKTTTCDAKGASCSESIITEYTSLLRKYLDDEFVIQAMIKRLHTKEISIENLLKDISFLYLDNVQKLIEIAHDTAKYNKKNASYECVHIIRNPLLKLPPTTARLETIYALIKSAKAYDPEFKENPQFYTLIDSCVEYACSLKQPLAFNDFSQILFEIALTSKLPKAKAVLYHLKEFAPEMAARGFYQKASSILKNLNSPLSKENLQKAEELLQVAENLKVASMVESIALLKVQIKDSYAALANNTKVLNTESKEEGATTSQGFSPSLKVVNSKLSANPSSTPSSTGIFAETRVDSKAVDTSLNIALTTATSHVAPKPENITQPR